MPTKLLLAALLFVVLGCSAEPTSVERSPARPADGPRVPPASSHLRTSHNSAGAPAPGSNTSSETNKSSETNTAPESTSSPTQDLLPSGEALPLGWSTNAPVPTSVSELFAEAEATARAMVDRYPDLPDAPELLARIFWIGGKPLKAERVWNDVLVSQPRYPYALHGLGQVAAKKGEFSTAADYHWQAYQALPTYVDAALGASNAWIKTGQVQRATELLETITSRYAKTSLGWIRLGQAYTAGREYASAESAFAKALALSPQNTEALYGFALAAARNGKREEAVSAQRTLADLRTAERKATLEKRKHTDDLANQKREIAAKYASIGQIYFANQQYDLAEAIWRRAAQLDKLNRDAREKLAGLHMGFQDAGAALTVCQELVQLDPGNVQYRMNLAMMLDRSGNPRQAIEAFQSLAQSNPSGRVLAMLADAQSRHGEIDAARQSIEKAIELEPENKQWQTIRDGLREQP